MTTCRPNSRFVKTAVLAILLFGCADSAVTSQNGYMPIGQCRDVDRDGTTTEYTVELGANGGARAGENFVLAIQSFHPDETNPAKIRAVRFGGLARLRPQQVANKCICGVQFRRSDDICAYISSYRAMISRDLLEKAAASGVDISFDLEDGRRVKGPRLSATDIAAFLARQ